MLTTKLSRRSFVKALGALTALAGLQKIMPSLRNDDEDWAAKFARTGVLEYVTLHLNDTLHLSKAFNGSGAIIRNCEFIATDNFKGDYLLDLGNAQGWTIKDCRLTFPEPTNAGALHYGS